MMNLIGNAIKFTDNGNITISSEENPDNSDQIIVKISDTGIGIPGDKINNIFESFEQADGSISRSHGGTGLGLAITKKILKLHGGDIWVKSQLGKGSTFYFTVNLSLIVRLFWYVLSLISETNSY